MKKLLVLALAMLLVMGLSAVGFALSSDANVDVNVSVPEYLSVEFLPHGADMYGLEIAGLFNGDDYVIGAPGIYISDGNSTETRVLDLWSDALAVAPDQNPDIFTYAPWPNTVEVFKVDANTAVNVTLSADFGNWMNAPTIFRVSSKDYAETDTGQQYIHGIGDWTDVLAEVKNTVDPLPENDAYKPAMQAHNDLVLDTPTFPLDFGGEYLCEGPLEFHVNAGLWMPKASQVAAGEYEAKITVTVAAQPQQPQQPQD